MSTKKKVDSRVRTLIENGVKSQHRSLFVIVGDHGKDQVVNLHYVLSKNTIMFFVNDIMSLTTFLVSYTNV